MANRFTAQRPGGCVKPTPGPTKTHPSGNTPAVCSKFEGEPAVKIPTLPRINPCVGDPGKIVFVEKIVHPPCQGNGIPVDFCLSG